MYIYVLIRKINTFVTGLCVNETLFNEVVGRMKYFFVQSVIEGFYFNIARASLSRPQSS